jgi:hypothetical protein
MTLILSAAGTPEPSSEIQKRLQRVHPDLALKYLAHIGQSWAVTMQWDANDRRQAQVRAQEIPASKAFDIIGYLPMDCSLDDAPGYLERMLRTFPSDASKRAADFVANEFAPASEALIEEAIEDAVRETGKRTGRRTKAR